MLENREGDEKYQVILRLSALLSAVFDRLEPLITPGASPARIRTEVKSLLQPRGIAVPSDGVAFCRNGYLHPPPNDDAPLRDNEAFTLDIWFKHDGYHADMARPYVIGSDADLIRLRKAALAAQRAAILAAKRGTQLIAIAKAVHRAATGYGCFVVPEACGHGIGKALHEEPAIPFDLGSPNLFTTISSGLIFTVEPAVSLSPVTLLHNRDGTVRSHTGEPILFAEAVVTPDKYGAHTLGK